MGISLYRSRSVAAWSVPPGAAEASTLAFPVGRWPLTVLFTHTEGRDIVLEHRRIERNGEVHIYEGMGTQDVVTLTVFND